MASLYNRSLEIIKQGQSASGAYIACPNFPSYQFAWLRDGSFTAHAMDTAGEFASAEAFFRWVGRTITAHAGKLDEIRRTVQSGRALGKDDVLHTRFTLMGEETTADSGWGNFQIDGYGTWLWALGEHIRLSGNHGLARELNAAAAVTLDYLELVWLTPNYDCWEEYPEYLHPYSLASAFAGFRAAEEMIRAGWLEGDADRCARLAANASAYLLTYGVLEGRLAKHIQPAAGGEPPKPIPNNGVDASLMGAAVPYGLLPLEHPILRATLQAAERDLRRPGGGVYRYRADVYYGGGEWILLTAWLGWVYVLCGQPEKAAPLLEWIEAQADADGQLPEQVNDHPLAAAHYQPWLKKWGPVARPLLWSHGMYIILRNALKGEQTHGG